MAAAISRERGPKRSLRRKHSDRYHAATGMAHSCSQSPSTAPSHRKKKYLFLEGNYYEEKRLQMLEEEGRSGGHGGGSGPPWMRAATASTPCSGAGGASPVATKRAESRLRMTAVDGFSAVGLSPRYSKVIFLPTQSRHSSEQYRTRMPGG